MGNAQKKSDILWNNGAQSNRQEKTFYSLVNIPPVYFAKHATKGSECSEKYKHAIAMCTIEQRFSDHNICTDINWKLKFFFLIASMIKNLLCHLVLLEKIRHTDESAQQFFFCVRTYT